MGGQMVKSSGFIRKVPQDESFLEGFENLRAELNWVLLRFWNYHVLEWDFLFELDKLGRRHWSEQDDFGFSSQISRGKRVIWDLTTSYSNNKILEFIKTFVFFYFPKWITLSEFGYCKEHFFLKHSTYVSLRSLHIRKSLIIM